jgi:hypothetical protein
MAFDYGSIDLGIRNPFRTEGTVRSIAGALVMALGIVALLSVQGIVASGERDQGIAMALVGLLLTGAGLVMAGRGLFKVFRFFVGRSVPADLAPNVEKSQVSKGAINPAYTDAQLEQMLQGRQNISFEEPDDWFSRLVHSVFGRLLYLPFAYRNLAQRLSRALTLTAVGLLSYALAWFSGVTGITDIHTTPVMDWLALLLAVYLLGVWFRASPRLARVLNERAVKMPGVLTLTLWIGAAILLPVLLMGWHAALVELPALPLVPGAYIASVVVLGVLSVVLFGALIGARSKTSNPVVEVAEFRDNWQKSVHPQEIFIHFENIVMANRRYKEVPNRMYRGFPARLFEQGSNDKGDFAGEMIQEVQPIFHTIPTVQLFHTLRLCGTALGAVLLLVASLFLYLLPGRTLAGESVATAELLATLPYLAIALTFGRLLVNVSETFWAEMQFESLLVYFQCRGTYTESKLSTGASIYDSTRSENTVVRSSMTLWVIASRFISSTFATSGAANLEQKRYVLEMHKAQPELDDIVGDLQAFLSKRETIAGLDTDQDLSAAARIHQVNQRTRAAVPQIGNHPPVDRERIADHTGDGAAEDGGTRDERN